MGRDATRRSSAAAGTVRASARCCAAMASLSAPSSRGSSSRRYEWAEAGALLHIDALRLAKFDRPGHWATGYRAEEHKTRNAGETVVIGVIDDHTRLAYCELHSAENAADRLGHAQARRRVVRRAGLRPGPSGHERQRQVLRPESPVRPSPQRHRRPPDPHPALHAALEREDRAVLQTAKREWSHGRVWQPHASATAPSHRSYASTTDNALTAPPAADRPSPAFTKTASRTPRPGPAPAGASPPRGARVPAGSPP